MDLARLQELKQKLQHEAKLADVWSFFLDEFGDHGEFIALGERSDDPFLQAVLAQIVMQMYPGAGAITRLLLTRLPNHQFIHGGFSVGNRLGGVFYFEDAHMGLAAVSDMPPGTETKFARFSGRPVRDPARPSCN